MTTAFASAEDEPNRVRRRAGTGDGCRASTTGAASSISPSRSTNRTRRRSRRRSSELVLGAGDAALIDQRHEARERYRQLVAAGAGWLPPWLVRRPMGTWTFAEAMTAMDDATAVLQQRDQIEAAAAALGLQPDDALKSAYETAPVNFDLRDRRRRRPARGPDRDRRRQGEARRAGRPRRPDRAARGDRPGRHLRRGTRRVRARRAGRGDLVRAAVSTLLAGCGRARPAAAAHWRGGGRRAAAPGRGRRPAAAAGGRPHSRSPLLPPGPRSRATTRRRRPAAEPGRAAPASLAWPREDLHAAPGPTTGTRLVAAHEGVARPGTAGTLRYTRHRSGQPFAAARREYAGRRGRPHPVSRRRASAVAA